MVRNCWELVVSKSLARRSLGAKADEMSIRVLAVFSMDGVSAPEKVVIPHDLPRLTRWSRKVLGAAIVNKETGAKGELKNSEPIVKKLRMQSF